VFKETVQSSNPLTKSFVSHTDLLKQHLIA